jgi:hypothetical protein
VRGIERHTIFNDDQDRYDFIKNLGLSLEQTKKACYAWSLIPNHFHLLLRTVQVPIITMMRRLLTGHWGITGKKEHPWRCSNEVLGHFGKKLNPARRRYKEFLTQGIAVGKREDLTGGGLIRNAGGWTAGKELRESQVDVKSDERILGDSDFVSEILAQAKNLFIDNWH